MIKRYNVAGSDEMKESTDGAWVRWEDFERIALDRPAIHAVFETVDPRPFGATGTTEAPIKRIEANDDGSFTVVIDHWPTPDRPPVSPGFFIQAKDAYLATATDLAPAARYAVEQVFLWLDRTLPPDHPLVVPRSALTEFIDKFCLGKPELIATAEAAFYAFNQAAIDRASEKCPFCDYWYGQHDEHCHKAQSGN